MAIKHTIRDNKGGTKEIKLTARTAILAFCYECMGWNYYEVEKCTSPLFPLFPFRNREATKGIRSVSQKAIQTLQKAGRERRQSMERVNR